MASIGTSIPILQDPLKEEVMEEVAEVIATMKMEYEERLKALEEQNVKQQAMIDDYIVPVITGTKSPAASALYGTSAIKPGGILKMGVPF